MRGGESATRPPAESSRDLVVWQRAHARVLNVYRITRGFPKEEVYGLTAQIRRAATAIAANIAEGFKRRGKLDKARFLNIAQASLEEVRYYLILARDLEYMTGEELNQLLDEVARLIEAYRQSIIASVAAPFRPVFVLALAGFCILHSVFFIPR